MPRTIGHYIPGRTPAKAGRAAVLEALQRLDEPVTVVDQAGEPAVISGGQAVLGGKAPAGALPIWAHVPALTPDRLGDPSFQRAYGVRCSYVTGAMANGIASADLVVAMAKAGLMGFFGAAGLSTERIREGLDRIEAGAPGLPFGVNLIHSPQEPHQEQETVDLLLARGVRNVEASAFLKLTPMIVQYRAAGLSRDRDGVRVANRVMAKVSREEVAVQFLRPAPEKMLRQLVEAGRITAEQASLAATIPMADDLTAEADSGGHTDNRPSLVLIPLMLMLRDRIAKETGYTVRIGAAGGLAVPSAIAAAFAAGADYVMTGTVNQACVESGNSALAKTMLADAGMADVDMAPASDMFEAGVKVQVLKRGTMFARRGEALYEAYRQYASWDDVPAAEKNKIEAQILRRPYADVWADCVAFFEKRDPKQLDRARSDRRHEMALVFRWYLGMSSRWAIAGDDSRKMDLQVWCGPAIGAFNEWTRGTFLADPAERRAVTVAANLLAGAAAITRARILLSQGVDPGPEALAWTPRRLA